MVLPNIEMNPPQVYILNPPPSSLPIPSLWVIPMHQPQASSIVRRTWTSDSFHTWYYTCFNAILEKGPFCLSFQSACLLLTGRASAEPSGFQLRLMIPLVTTGLQNVGEQEAWRGWDCLCANFHHSHSYCIIWDQKLERSYDLMVATAGLLEFQISSSRKKRHPKV